MEFKPKFLATGIGSMPFMDPKCAVETVLKHLPDAPFWPQLPKLGLNEQMEVQYSEGMPCVCLDREKGRMFLDTSSDYSDPFAEFYEIYAKSLDPPDGDGSCTAMAISQDFSKGICEFEKQLQASRKTFPFLKVQTTGPCSFALTIVDEKKKAIYYNEEFRDMVIKALAMKCRWQIHKFRGYAQEVICFIDEPILSAFGSSTYVSVKREDIVSHLREVIEAIHAEHAIAGVHCCGNTEWSILTDAGVDIVNFDAFGYGETIAMYPEAVNAFLKRGGALAWGIVPTSTAIREQTIDALTARFEMLIDHLAARGIDRQIIVEQAMVTPSCGTGSMEPEDAERVFSMLDSVSRSMKQKYGY